MKQVLWWKLKNQHPDCRQLRIHSSGIHNFLARHGIIDTTTISLRLIPILSAKYVLAIAPNICCGDFAVDGTSLRSGKYSSKKLTQPGQHDVRIGILAVLSPFRYRLSLSRSSVPSSIIVRSAAKSVSNT